MNFENSLITFVSALFFGIFFIIIANKLRISSIVILLIGGIILGPSFIWPDLIHPDSLGDGLKIIVKLAVAIILFEGGLTLDIKGYRIVSGELKRALTIGVLITWILSSITIKFIFDFDWLFSILTGSLIIVTGPTVITPLLKRINVKKKINSFLHWEGVLIDPIGVFIALLTYEWIIGHNAVALFSFRILTGIGMGLLSGYSLYFFIKRKIIPDEYLNVFTLTAALVIFALSDMIVQESGLMSVVVAGLFVGYKEPPDIENIKIYKEQLTELLIGLLFILLAANLDIESFQDFNVLKIALAVIIVMFLIRPINIFISTFGKSNFSFKEKLFLSWIAPRGIVAASMASLFTLNLSELNLAEYSQNYIFLEDFTYSVIIGTVIFQGFSAKLVGRFLGVLEPEPTSWLIVGAHPIGQVVAKFIQERGFSATLIDTNMHAIKNSHKNNLTAISANALLVDPDDFPELYGIGNVLAVTKNDHLNNLICQRWKKLLKKPNLYNWQSLVQKNENETELKETPVGKQVWNHLELNKITAMHIDESDFTVFTREIDSDAIKHPERVLMYFENNKLIPYVPDEAHGECTCIVYHPFMVKPEFNIKPKWILFLKNKKYKEIIYDMLQNIAKDFKEIDSEKLLSQLMAQEREFPSAIGYETALPHAYIEGIGDSIVLMAKTTKPVTCDFTSEKIQYIFLVLSPKDKPDTHIKTLSNISKFIINEERRRLLLEASNQNELRTVFFPE